MIICCVLLLLTMKAPSEYYLTSDHGKVKKIFIIISVCILTNIINAGLLLLSDFFWKEHITISIIALMVPNLIIMIYSVRRYISSKNPEFIVRGESDINNNDIVIFDKR